MPTVYVESSVPSAYATTRTDPSSLHRRRVTREWWAAQAARFELRSSVEVLRELSDPAFEARDDALGLLGNVPLLDITNEVIGVATAFVRHRLMPGPVESGDAIHVAVACVHAVDFLLSWNVQHLANPNKIRHLGVMCQRLGLVPPLIITPEALWE